MGFRNPVTSVTDVDTGGPSPVVITGTGGLEGGGAVLLYPNTGGDDPGRLEAGSDESGGLTRLDSPPNLLGLASTLILAGVDNPAVDGVYLDSTGGMRFVPAPGRDFTVDGPLALLNSWKIATVTTDGAGVFTLAHGLGYTPGMVWLQSRSTTTSPVTFGLSSISATSFVARAYLGAAPAASASIPLAWLALR